MANLGSENTRIEGESVSTGEAVTEQIADDTGTDIPTNNPFSTNIRPRITPYEYNALMSKRVCWQDEDTLLGAESGTLYESTDNGDTWDELGDAPTTNVVIKLDSGTLLAVGGDTNDYNVHRSTDDGGSWSQVLDMDAQMLDHGITETPNGNVVVGEYISGSSDGTDVSIYLSTDDGSSWSGVYTANDEWHCIQWDRHRENLVAFNDDETDSQIHVSEDQGQTWSMIGESTSRWHPDYVEAMFFEDHVAWVPDYGNGPLGVLQRISAEDFYNGDWGEETVDGYGQLATERQAYHTLEVADGIWLVSIHPTDRTSEEPGGDIWSSEVTIVYDEGRKYVGGLEWGHIQTRFDEAEGGQPQFPRTTPDEPLEHDTWVRLFSDVTNIEMPISVTWSDDKVRFQQANVGDFIQPNGVPLRMRDTDGELFDYLWSDGNEMRLRNNALSENPEIRLRSSGTWLEYDGSPQIRAYDDSVRMYNRVNMDGNRVYNVPQGSAQNNEKGIEFSGNAGLYVNDDGHVVAVSEDGTETVFDGA